MLVPSKFIGRAYQNWKSFYQGTLNGGNPADAVLNTFILPAFQGGHGDVHRTVSRLQPCRAAANRAIPPPATTHCTVAVSGRYICLYRISIGRYIYLDLSSENRSVNTSIWVQPTVAIA
jgi:hypothetical protein